ncbi:MAG: hypothetical protein ACJA1C_002730 [Crocinitomicaceae bacterium]|jgi:hypothetical protein
MVVGIYSVVINYPLGFSIFIELNLLLPFMKNLLLITCILFCSHSSFGQYSRSFYTTYTSVIPRTFEVADLDGETHFVSMKESIQDTIQLLSGKIDQYGETSNYIQKEITGVSYNKIAVSGIGTNSTDELVIAVITNSGPSGSLIYLNLNVTTENVVVAHTMPIVIDGPFARTRQIGDSLVTFITEENVGLVRIAAALNNPSAYSYTVIEPGLNLIGSLSGNARRTELKTDSFGNEIVCVGNRLLKTHSSGTMTAVTIPSFIIQELTGATIAVAANGNILAMTDTKFALFDSGLNSLDNGLLNYSLLTSTRFYEVMSEGNNWIVYANNSNSKLERIIFNNSMSLVQSDVISDGLCRPLDLFAISGLDCLLLENRDEITSLPTDQYSLGILKMDSSIPKEFIEFGQPITHQQLDINIAHRGIDFLKKGLQTGINYNLTGVKREIFSYAESLLVGFDADNNFDTDVFAADSTFPGPFTTATLDIIHQYDKYNRAYYVDHDMINTHLWEITNNNPNYVIPFGIREWPAHGDVLLGQTENLAPFIDQNSNSIYEPELGDYPEILGSRCLLNIYHENPNSNVSGLEHHQYFYVFNCDTSDVLNNTIFITERIFARAGDYTNAYYTKRTDGDIGNYTDDYAGTNVELGMVYFSNGDNYDEDAFGNIGFHDTLSAYGVQLLKGVELQTDGLDNPPGSGLPINGYGFGDGQIDNEFSTLESSIFTSYPGNILSWYNMAQGLLPDGTVNSVNGVDIRYDYFDDTDPTFYASGGVNHGNAHFESTAGNTPGERQILGSSDIFNLYAGGANDHIEFTTAYIAAIDTNQASLNYYQPVKKLFQLGTTLKSMYAANDAGCGLTFSPYTPEQNVGIDTPEINDFGMFPNPTSNSFTVVQDVSDSGLLKITSLNGTLIMEKSIGKEQVISMKDAAPGMYLITLITENSIVTKQLLKR